MYFYFVFLLSALLSADDSGASFSGTVSRSENDLPLKGANVTLTNTSGRSFGASTDKNGQFNIVDLPEDNYSLVVSFIGFEDFRDNLKIDENKTYKVDAALSIKPILMTKLEIISDASTPYKDLPGSATVMGAQTLKLLNPIGTQEMLEYVPGVHGFSDDGIGNSRISVSIRGLNPRRSSRVLILEDGIPIQPALYVYPNMYYNPPADRIDQLEVIKGSGSMIFGPQTMGGVINYFTRRPRQDFGGLLRLTVGENGYNSTFFELGGFGNNKLKPEFQLLYKAGDGFRENNDFTQLNGTFKLNYTRSVNHNTYLKVNINDENTNATYTGLTEWSFSDSLAKEDYNGARFNPKEHDNFKIFRAAVDLIDTEQISSARTRTSKLFVSYFDRRWWRENDIFISPRDLDDYLAGSQPERQPYYSSSDLVRVGDGESSLGILRTFYVAGLEQSYSIKHQFMGFDSKMDIGGRLYFERFKDDKQKGDEPDSREGVYFLAEDSTIVGQSHHYESTALSAFISESIRLGSLILRPGLRYEIFEQERIDRLAGSTYLDKTTSVLLPGFGFINKFNNISLFGGIHRGFTPPSSGALKILNFGENVAEGGLDIEAEKSWNKEIGFRGTLASIDFELSGFHVDVENLVAAGRGTAFSNLGKVQTYGLELASKLNYSRLSPILPDVNLAYTLLETNIIDGNIKSNLGGGIVSIKGKELPYAPRHTFIVGLESKIFSKINYKLDFKYVDQVYTDFENIEKIGNKGIVGPVDSYGIINFSFDYNMNEKTRIFVSAKNLLDEIYIGSRLHSNPGQPEAHLSSGILPGPRRQVNVGIDYAF